MSRSALYQNILQAQQRGLDRNLQMNQDMMTNLGKLAGGIYGFADKKREKQVEQFDKEVEKKRKGYLDKIDMFGTGTQGQMDAQKALDAYDDEMSKRRESIVNRGFTDYLGFGDDPSSPSAKLEDVEDPLGDQYKPGTGARDAFKARRYETSILGAEGPGLGGVDDVTPTMANMAQQEEDQEKGFLEQRGLTSYDPLIGRYNKADLKRNTDIRDRVNEKKAIAEADIEIIPKLGAVNREEGILNAASKYDVRLTDLQLKKLAQMSQAEIGVELVRMDMVQKKQVQLDAEKLAKMAPLEREERLKDIFSDGGAKLSIALGEYASKKGLDLEFLIRQTKDLAPIELENLLTEIEKTAEPKADAARILEQYVGQERTTQKVNEQVLLDRQAIKQAREMARVMREEGKKDWRELEAPKREEINNMAVKLAIATNDADLMKEAARLGIFQRDDKGNLVLDDYGNPIGDYTKGITTEQQYQELQQFVAKADAQLEADEKRADSVTLFHAEVERLKTIDASKLENLREHEKILAQDDELHSALLKNLEAQMKLEEDFSKRKEERLEGYKLASEVRSEARENRARSKNEQVQIRAEKRRKQEKLEDENRSIRVRILEKGLANLKQGTGKDGEIIMEDVAPYLNGLGMSEEQGEDLLKVVKTMANNSAVERKIKLGTSGLLPEKQSFELLQKARVIPTGMKYEDWSGNRKLLQGMIDSGRPELIDEGLMEAAGFTSNIQKTAIRNLGKLNEEKENLNILNARIGDYMRRVAPTDVIEDPEQARQQRLEFATELHKELSADPRFKPLLDRHGIIPSTLHGKAEQYALAISKDLADIDYKLESGKAKILSSKGKGAKNTPLDKVFEKRLSSIMEEYDGDNVQKNLKIRDLITTLKGIDPSYSPSAVILGSGYSASLDSVMNPGGAKSSKPGKGEGFIIEPSPPEEAMGVGRDDGTSEEEMIAGAGRQDPEYQPDLPDYSNLDKKAKAKALQNEPMSMKMRRLESFADDLGTEISNLFTTASQAVKAFDSWLERNVDQPISEFKTYMRQLSSDIKQ